MFNGLGEERAYEPDILNYLADNMKTQVRFLDAIEVYEYLQERWPLAPDNPVYQNNIAQLYSAIPDTELSSKASAKLEEMYNDRSEWWEANRINPDAQATARAFIETSLSTVARQLHQKAMTLGEQLAMGGDEESELVITEQDVTNAYLAAGEKYQEYIQKFPFADDYYEVTFYLAATMIAAKRPSRRSPNLSSCQVEKKHEYGEQAATSAGRPGPHTSNRSGRTSNLHEGAEVEETLEVPSGERIK